MIYNIRHNCTQQVLLSLYFSLFHSHLSYGLSLWGTNNVEYLSKLTTLQKKIIRSITISDFNAHTTPLFKRLKILKLNDLYNHKILSLMWDFYHNALPSSLSTLFTWREEIHNLNLRDKINNKLYTAHRFHNRHGYDSFTHYGATLLNKVKELPCYQDCPSKAVFQYKYKSYILDAYL